MRSIHTNLEDLWALLLGSKASLNQVSNFYSDASGIRVGKPLHFVLRLSVEGWLASQAVKA